MAGVGVGGHYRTDNAALCAIVCWADGSYCTMMIVLYSPRSTWGSTVRLSSAQFSTVRGLLVYSGGRVTTQETVYIEIVTQGGRGRGGQRGRDGGQASGERERGRELGVKLGIKQGGVHWC